VRREDGVDVDGGVAVITGGASGIGRATALALAARGCDVVVVDLHEERTAETVAAVEATGRRALGVRCDVTSDDDVERLARTAIDWQGHVDVVMNNAGNAVLGRPELVPMSDWEWLLQVNTLGPVRGARAFIPHLLERGRGWIVNTASIAGLYAYSYDAIPYITSKHAVVGLSEGLYLYLKPRGIGVSCLCPGLVATHLGETGRFHVDDPTFTNFPLIDQPALDPAVVGELVADAIRDERFLLLTHESDGPLLQERWADRDGALGRQVDALYAGRNPDGTVAG
jgi:NAD(P)-dependent dehydrogenase (short-subunit alcohol dehydrogenase family)